jgi:hypothetical protein
MKTYFHEYAHKKHAKYVEDVTGKKISDLGKKVANILGYVGGGIYNCPIDITKIDWEHDYCIRVFWHMPLVNFDGFALSKLWVLCHRNMVRVEIDAVKYKSYYHDEDEDSEIQHEYTAVALSLMFHQRKTRTGCVSERLPDCEDMIRDIDDDYNGNSDFTEIKEQDERNVKN